MIYARRAPGPLTQVQIPAFWPASAGEVVVVIPRRYVEAVRISTLTHTGARISTLSHRGRSITRLGDA